MSFQQVYKVSLSIYQTTDSSSPQNVSVLCIFKSEVKAEGNSPNIHDVLLSFPLISQRKSVYGDWGRLLHM